MDRLRSIEAFVRVADTRSFAEAARQLGVAKSVVTTRIQQLEDFVQAQLFHRTTRAVQLSTTGAAFYAECAELVTRTAQLVDHMRDLRGAPAGVLRVHALPGFAIGRFGDQLRGFQEAYPGIVLDLTVSDAIVDPVREGYDCVLQIFEPISDTLVARKLFGWRPVFCASPDYLARHPAPTRPAQLAGPRLGLYSRYPTRDTWVFTPRRRGARAVAVELAPFLRTNSVHLLRDYAVAGAGLVCLPTLVAADALTDGRLVALLPGWALPAFWLCAVYAARAHLPLRVKLFLDELARKPTAVPAWDRALIERGIIPAGSA